MRLFTDQDLLDMMAPEDGGLVVSIAGVPVPCRFFDQYADAQTPSGMIIESNVPTLWVRTVDVPFVNHGSRVVIEPEDGGRAQAYVVRKIRKEREGQTFIELSEADAR